MQNDLKKLMIVDAYSQIFRWFYAMPLSFKLPDGAPINALFGMTKFLFNLEKNFKNDYKAFAFDLGGSVLRLTELPEYKSNRKPMPEELRSQISLIKEMVAAFGWTLFFSEGYEADDIIATLVKAHKEYDISIITADKDIAQVIKDPHVRILIPERSSPNFFNQDEAAVVMRFGVNASQIIDYLSLIGDSSDFISGINGFGPKTAINFLKEVGSLDAFYQNPERYKNEKMRLKLLNEKEKVERNIRLIKLHDSVPALETAFAQMQPLPKIDFDRIADLILKYHLRSLRAELLELAKRHNYIFADPLLAELTEKTPSKNASKEKVISSDDDLFLHDDASENRDEKVKERASQDNSCDDLFSNFNF